MSNLWVELTQKDLQARIDECTVAIWPIGATEQHGYHLPVACDALLAEGVARGAAETVKEMNLLVLPTLTYGLSGHHMSLSGTLTLQPETMLAVISDICDALIEQGVRRLVLLNGHGGNSNILGVAVSKLGRKYKGRAHIAGVTYWQLITEHVKAIRDGESGSMGHAGEFETSLMLELLPSLVRLEEGQPFYPQTTSYFKTDLFESSPVQRYVEFGEVSPSGTFGDPSLASAGKGKEFLDLCVRELCSFLREFSDLKL